jgi:hypothetical protein
MRLFPCRHVPLFGCAIFLLTAPARAVTVTDFSNTYGTTVVGGDWGWDSPSKTLTTLFSNSTSDYLFQELYFPYADITGGQSVSLTGDLVTPGIGAGDFILNLENNGALIATGSFSFSQFASGTTTVTSPLTFSSTNRIIDQWYILGNGNPSTYMAEITFTNMVVSVPEPSTCAMALAGLACGGYAMWRRRLHRDSDTRGAALIRES